MSQNKDTDIDEENGITEETGIDEEINQPMEEIFHETQTGLHLCMALMAITLLLNREYHRD